MTRTLWLSMLAALGLSLLLVSPAAALKPAPCNDIHQPVLCFSDGYIYWNICFANAAHAFNCVPYDPRAFNAAMSTPDLCPSSVERINLWEPSVCRNSVVGLRLGAA
jgi:hypothetical protein